MNHSFDLGSLYLAFPLSLAYFGSIYIYNLNIHTYVYVNQSMCPLFKITNIY